MSCGCRIAGFPSLTDAIAHCPTCRESTAMSLYIANVANREDVPLSLREQAVEILGRIADSVKSEQEMERRRRVVPFVRREEVSR
jgi:hypothetical protein